MAVCIDATQVRHVAKLARLSLSDEEVARFAGQLSAVLAYFEQLNGIDTTAVEPLYHPLDACNVTRADEPLSERDDGFDLDAALHNAPELHGRCFRVPGVFGESS